MVVFPLSFTTILPQRLVSISGVVCKIMGCLTNGLEDQRDPALLGIGVSNGQGDAFAEMRVKLDDNKLPRPAFACNMGSLHPELEDALRKLYIVILSFPKALCSKGCAFRIQRRRAWNRWGRARRRASMVTVSHPGRARMVSRSSAQPTAS